MISIIHISDPHAEGETMRRLDQLACSLPKCEVLALTGDCTSNSTDQLPQKWDNWPQRLKISVPGNHDYSYTFDLLPNWISHTPWAYRLDDLIFIGIDSSDNFSYTIDQLQQLDRSEIEGGSALVILTHRWSDSQSANEVAKFLGDFTSCRSLLVLHGHEHPASFDGSFWDESASIGQLKCYRSKVTSCSRPKRGCAHLIIWENGSFRYSVIRGDDPLYEAIG